MENNKCCTIFSSSSFSGTKINGRRNFSRVSKHSRFDYRIFSIFRVFVWASVWLCPCIFRSALAEQDYTGMINGILTNTGQIEGELGNIRASLDNNIVPDLEENRQYLYYIKSNSDFLKNGFGYFGGSAGVFKDDVNTVILSLAEIHDNITVLQDGITELELVNDKLDSILDYLNGTGGSGGNSSLPTDIATETTLSAFKSKYEDLSNQFLTSWGFVGGSDGTFKDLITPFYSSFGQSKPYTYTNFVFSKSLSGTNSRPFPITVPSNSQYYWFSDNYTESLATKNFSSPFEFLAWSNGFTLSKYFTRVQSIAKKQSWNDWYAHTNSVARLDMIIESLNTVPDVRVDSMDDIGTIDENQLNITFDKATGDSPDSVDLQPAFTNDVAELTEPVHSLTNKVANLITYSKLSNRYKTPNIDNTNYRDYGITYDIPDYNLQYGTRPQMSFKFTSTARNLFRGFLSRERMETLRNIFLKLWAFLAIYCNFLIFKIFGKMGGNE